MLSVGLLACMAALCTAQGPSALPEPRVGVYDPIPGGWQIRIAETGDRPAPGSGIGVVEDDYRQHRRPLYPPADRSLVWTDEEIAKLTRSPFRPLVVAYNEPRFLFDFHAAGGLLGHLYLGFVRGDAGKWFHRWTDVDVRYVDGRMEYRLRDAAFPGVEATLSAAPLADAAGLAVKLSVTGTGDSDRVVWAYGGASAFFTNYAMTAPEFAFAPEQCAKDRVRWADGRFEIHRAFDDSDVVTKEPFCAWRKLPGWEAVVRGATSWSGRTGFGDPAAFADSPVALAASTTWADAAADKTACVAVGEVVPEGDGYFVVGMGREMPGLADPARSWADALARNDAIARRIQIQTPDPYLNAAVNMMAFAQEGTWGDIGTVHGGWSWRFAYLGWRTAYGPLCYGWTDRIRQYIRSHATLGVVREGDDAGAIGSMLEYDPNVYYNMNEVFLDHVRAYFDYTNDLDLMREIFPVLEGILQWEDRRLQPGDEGLYENALNTWISDSHWYTRGQCTQASAYMLNAYRFMADLAPRIGRDPAPFRAQAERIREAMQRKLWMPDKGVFAEYLDTRGNKMLHAEPELPTIYHSAEFGAASPEQIAQMLRWVDANLRHESTPGGGTLVWSSNWFPNRGRSYTHSTYELAYAEEMNYALTNYLVGRSDEAYALIRATLCGIFNGPTPGGLSCHVQTDGRQRANDEFADASSMWARAVVEGLFGIVPKRPEGRIDVTPQFPTGWDEASITTPLLAYHWTHKDHRLRVRCETPAEASVRFRFPLKAETVERVALNERSVTAQVENGPAGVTWVTVDVPAATSGDLTVAYTPRPSAPPAETAPAPKPQPRIWKAPDAGERDLTRWSLVDLSPVFNDAVTDVLTHVTERAPAPEPPASPVGVAYWKQHLLQYHGSRTESISDAAWRAKVGSDGVAWTRDGIPFRTAKEGPNIAVVSVTAGFPAKVAFPAAASGKTLYLMIGGMTFPVQSHVPNLRVTLRYADGTTVARELVNPFDIGDCWSTWCGRYHDCAANGFENIGGRRGPEGSADVADLTQPVELDTEAHLVAFDLQPGGTLAEVEIEAIANDAIFGIMGASVLH